MRRDAVILWLARLLVLQTAGTLAATVDEASRLVDEGRWREAGQQIERRLAQPGLSPEERQAWLFQRERMARIRLDFDASRAQVLSEARRVAPPLSEELFDRWEKAGAIECLDVDGQRWFFHSAADNLFRVNSEARALKLQNRPASGATPGYRIDDIRRILARYDQTGERCGMSRRWRVTYTVTIKPDAVPASETIRAWLPAPHAGDRQSDVRLISTDPPCAVPSEASAALASVYLEKTAVSNQPTRFRIVFEYTASGFHQELDPAQVRPAPKNDPSVARFLVEQPPHLVFPDAIRRASQEIVGGETNPYLKARRIFQWIVAHIPWAEAREYSTLNCLPQYALDRRQGDCGIQTMLFMTLCRLNGIPARWESGWITGPDKNMHDWCQIYLAPYGWVPVDVSYGLVTSAVEREKWFYLGGIDSYRLVVNTDHSQPLAPAKSCFRSEFVDFQRGEFEWRGGNLYFNQWHYDFAVEEVAPSQGAGVPTGSASR